MDLRRFWRHVVMGPWASRRCFPSATLDAIEREIGAQERRHRGELRFVVEAELSSMHLWRDVGSRDRAREVFAQAGVWNTEENTGVLVYLLLADRRVEVIADRGITAKVSEDEWRSICTMMEAHFRDGRYEEGAIAGIRRISEHLAQHFPAHADNPNELPDRPLLI
jgi:uncharacterized membrane protein